MGYFITDPVGLIIAVLNVATVLLLIICFLKAAAEGRSKLLRVLERIFAPILYPLRRLLPVWRFDIAPIILAAVLQLIVMVIKRGYRY